MAADQPHGSENQNASPAPRGSVARIELCLPSLVTLTGYRSGIWVIQPEGNVSAEAAPAIRRALGDLSAAEDPLGGLLIDLRGNARLSVVRLSDLIDELSVFGVRIAVLFDDDHRCKLAQVLYGTLVDKRNVAYFVTQRDAYAFLHHGSDNGDTDTETRTGSATDDAGNADNTDAEDADRDDHPA